MRRKKEYNININLTWDTVTLRQYCDIKQLLDGEETADPVKIMSIVSDKDEDYIRKLPIELYTHLYGSLCILNGEELPDTKPNNTVEIEGERYTIHFENQLKVGEYIAATTVIKDDENNLPAILAIMCRKDGEDYDSHFENEVLPDRIKLFEGQPISKMYPLLSFFLLSFQILNYPTLLSSMIQEEINHTRQDISNFAQSGEISRRSMKSAMKTLSKLEKSISRISRTISN